MCNSCAGHIARKSNQKQQVKNRVMTRDGSGSSDVLYSGEKFAMAVAYYLFLHLGDSRLVTPNTIVFYCYTIRMKITMTADQLRLQYCLQL